MTGRWHALSTSRRFRVSLLPGRHGTRQGWKERPWKYRPLGRTGWKVSTLGFGAWAIGGDAWGQTDDRQSLATTGALKRDATAEEGAVSIPGVIHRAVRRTLYRERQNCIACLESGADYLLSPEGAFAAMNVALAVTAAERSGPVVNIATFDEAR